MGFHAEEEWLWKEGEEWKVTCWRESRCSPFFSEENRGMSENLVRFAFCKTDDTLQEAAEAFAKVAEAAAVL